MPQERAIPKGYMTVGELAKKMGTTVRTLQYYDKLGLFAPSAQSEGGRRLYTDRDMVFLHQIFSLKSLGFSLEEIKEELIPLDSPEEVAQVLARQEEMLRRRMELMQTTITDLAALRQEVMAMQTVDFEKYAAIITNLQIKNREYWMIKYMDDDTLAQFKVHMDVEEARNITADYNSLMTRAAAMVEGGVDHASPEGQAFAAEFWRMTENFTRGDRQILGKLIEMGNMMGDGRVEGPDGFDSAAFAGTATFVGMALDHYLGNLGIDPFGDRKEEV
ncbi:MAG: MerR family transcriptional regulator [Clostridia bacterium]|nr:MerR family transcriptional regulator [Clostridia bacterium]